MIVNVELLEYPEDGARAVGRVIEILGRPDDFGIDVEIVIRKHHLPHQFPPEVVEQAQAIPVAIAAGELEGRRDFRGARHRHHRRRDRARFRRCRVGGSAGQRQLRAAGPHRRRQPLRAPGHAHRRGGAAARHQRLFSGPRRAHAAVRAFDQHLLAGSARGPAGAFGAAGDRPSRRRGGAGSSPRRDSQRRAHDVHQRPPAAGRRRGAARALPAAGGALRADAGAGADAEPQARAPRLDRFRPARSRSSSSTNGAR